MIRFLILFTFLLMMGRTFAQKVPDAALIPTNIDSIRLRVELNRGKELLLRGEEETHELLGTALLSSNDNKKFLKRLSKNNSYINSRALLTHHSLVFTCFSADKVTVTVEISTLTRNIDIYKEGGAEFYGKISKKMGNYLVKLLIKYRLYESLQEIGDTEGIE